jgi:hypothetical protein
MGEPMDRSHRVFFKLGPFEEAFPTLEEATVEFTEYDFLQEVRRGTWRVSGDGGLMPCGNTFCRRGGYELDREIHEIVRLDSLEKEVRLDCLGDEGSPKGRRRGRRCQRHIEAKIRLQYKNGAGPGRVVQEVISEKEVKLPPPPRLLVKPSFIRPGLGDACTLCLHEGAQIWRKTYRDERLAWLEADEMGLIDRSNVRGEKADPARHPLSRALVPEASIEIERIVSRGFSK